MKKSNFLRPALACAAIIAIVSCNNGGGNNSNNPNDTTTKMAVAKNDSTFNKTGEKDANALVDAYNSSLMEEQLSDSISAVTKSADVKALATAMAAAHGKLNEKIRNLAAQKQITLPSGLSDDDKNKIVKLAAEKEKDLNKDYVDKLVSAHKDAISFFEKNANNAVDADIKALFTNTLPELHNHLDMALNEQDKLKAMK